VLPLLTLAVIAGAWELISRLEVVDPIIVPPFTEVVKAFVDLCGEGYFWTAVRITLTETLAGFALGCGVGFVLGTLVGTSETIRYAIYPLVIAYQNTPQVALAPVFLTWFGFGLTSKIVMAATICFFPVLIAVVVGLQTVDEDGRRLMQSFGSSRWQTYRKLSLPSSLPYVFAGLKQGLALALIGAVVAEFVGASDGIGVLIGTFNVQLDVAMGFAAILALMLIGLILFGLAELIDRKVVFWRAR
jgi:NitT/TauT family transport system permease protein